MPRKRFRARHFAVAFTCAAACVAAIIYVVGSNIPDISVRVAAMQTGIKPHTPHIFHVTIHLVTSLPKTAKSLSRLTAPTALPLRSSKKNPPGTAPLYSATMSNQLGMTITLPPTNRELPSTFLTPLPTQRGSTAASSTKSLPVAPSSPRNKSAVSSLLSKSVIIDS